MDMSLQSLFYDKPLGDEIDRISDFVDVSRYKKLTLCVYSDTLTDIHIEWSYNGITKCLSSAIKVASRHWRSERVEVLMPFMRLHIINNSGALNLELITRVFNLGRIYDKESTISQAPPPKEAVRMLPSSCSEVTTDDHHVTLQPAAKKAWYKKALSPKHQCRDDRIQGFLPKNSLLTTDSRGNIVPLAPGNVNDVLVMGSSGPQWLSLKESSDT